MILYYYRVILCNFMATEHNIELIFLQHILYKIAPPISLYRRINHKDEKPILRNKKKEFAAYLIILYY